VIIRAKPWLSKNFWQRLKKLHDFENVLGSLIFF